MDELEQLRAERRALAELLQALSSSRLRLEPMLEQILRSARGLCDADSGFFYLSDGAELRLVAGVGTPPSVIAWEKEHPDRPQMGSCTGRVAMTGALVHIPDTQADPDYEYQSDISGGDPRTLLGLPVMLENDVRGIIGLARAKPRPFSEAELGLMELFASQAAIAVGNAELFETVERQKAELSRFLSPEVAALVSSDDGAKLLAGHRAYITVAYFDLRGFTAFAETAEPEELIDVIRDYHAAAGELVVHHGGTLEHFAGDGLMVFFNDPVPLEDHELHAAQLAIELRDRIHTLARGWAKLGYDLGLGCGIAAGHATLGRIGFEGRYDYGALGTVTNLAARLSDEAGKGEILLNQRAFARLEEQVEAEPAGELTIKGFRRPIAAYRLVGLR